MGYEVGVSVVQTTKLPSRWFFSAVYFCPNHPWGGNFARSVLQWSFWPLPCVWRKDHVAAAYPTQHTSTFEAVGGLYNFMQGRGQWLMDKSNKGQMQREQGERRRKSQHVEDPRSKEVHRHKIPSTPAQSPKSRSLAQVQMGRIL